MTPLVLLCPHTHAGKPFKAGNRIVADVATADWLIANGIARHDRPTTSIPHPEGDGLSVEPKSTPRKEPKP